MAKVITLNGLPMLRGFGGITPVGVGKYVVVGGLGAGAGYFLLKNQIGGPWAAVVGGSVAALALLGVNLIKGM